MAGVMRLPPHCPPWRDFQTSPFPIDRNPPKSLVGSCPGINQVGLHLAPRRPAPRAHSRTSTTVGRRHPPSGPCPGWNADYRIPRYGYPAVPATCQRRSRPGGNALVPMLPSGIRSAKCRTRRDHLGLCVAPEKQGQPNRRRRACGAGGACHPVPESLLTVT